MNISSQNKEYIIELLLFCALYASQSIYYSPDYKTINNYEYIKEESKYMITKEKLESISKSQDSEKKVLNIIIDSDNHGINTKKIVDTKLANSNSDIKEKTENIFINKWMYNDYLNDYSKILTASSVKSNYFMSQQRNQLKAYKIIKSRVKDHEILETFAKNNPSKELYFNMSYGIVPDIKYYEDLHIESDSNSQSNKSSLDLFLDNANNRNIELLKIIEKYPNIHLYKSAGNNFLVDRISNTYIIDKLLPYYMKYSRGNYEKMVELSSLFYSYIEGIKNNTQDPKKELEKELKKINIYLTEKKLDYLLTLHIYDYLYTYETTNLLMHLNADYKHLSNRVKSVESFSDISLRRNFLYLKKYNYKIDDKELYDYLNDITYYAKYNEYDQDEIVALKQLYNKYADKYPELFKITEYGTLVDLKFKNTEALAIGPTYHNVNYSIVGGTSLTSPDLMSDDSLDFSKRLVNKE